MATKSLPIVDRRERPLRDLRVSVTDRCNFRCRYCMPREHFGSDFRFLPRAEILSFEEIARVARLFASSGTQKIRLTGGEPLLRAELEKLVRMLSQIPGVDLALTTNGSLLAQQAEALRNAGLERVTVSLDSLDEDVFHEMTDSTATVAQVLAGIEAARAAGIGPIKINAVVRRGLNDHTLVDLARHFKGSGTIVRFIEFMDVGTTNAWNTEAVVSGAEIVERISRELPLEPASPSYRGEVAKRWRYRDGSGEIGVITSVTQPFCGDCSRARLSAEGTIYTCLFAQRGTDLRDPLRAGASDAELLELVKTAWRARDDRYSEIRGDATKKLRRIEMSYIGG
jgi:cyclic pyranopterin phosphate synthase